MDPQLILVVDDEPRITDLVAMALRYEGFEVATAGTGRAGLKLVEEFRPALIVLDVMLPDMEGFAVTERLAADRVKVPVLFLTARDAVEDKVRGLTLGGDDYVTKPFSIEELVARIRAVLRRAAAGPADVLEAGELVVDRRARQVRVRGVPVSLAGREFDLAVRLASDPTRVFTKDELLRDVWGARGRLVTRTDDSHASRLRNKLRAAGAELPYVINVWGRGYRLLE